VTRRTFGLVHGAYQGSWCWQPLISELRRRGHDAVAVDLPCEDPCAGAHRYTEAALSAFATAPEDLILIGHSLGGLTIPLVAERRRVSRLVFLNALVPRVGGTHDDAARAEPDMLMPRPVGGFSVDGQGVVRVNPDAAHEWLFADCSPDIAAWAAAQLRGQAWAITAEVSPLTGWPDVPRTSLVGIHDRVVNPAWSRRAAEALLGVVPVVLDEGHSPFLASPSGFAEILLGLP
jgi:pimeloyl-ACP methyl ester carboxylesterase